MEDLILFNPYGGQYFYLLLHETYANLDRLDVQFLLHPRETAPSCPQTFTLLLRSGFTDKPSALFVQFSRLIDAFRLNFKIIIQLTMNLSFNILRHGKSKKLTKMPYNLGN